MIKRFRYEDIEKIQKFIHQNFKENHPLSTNKALFVHEYVPTYDLLENPEINMYGDVVEGEIQSILGFYLYSTDLYLSMWSAKKNTISGILVFQHMLEVFSDCNVYIIGLSEDAKKVYGKLNFNVEKFNFLYFKKQELDVINAKISCCSDEYDEHSKFQSDYDSFVYKRFIDNPFEEYKKAKYLNTSIYYRIIDNSGNPFVSIVYVEGEITDDFVKLTNFILNNESLDYAAMYTNQIIKGFEDVYTSPYVFSVYERPYVAQNIEIYYAYKGEARKLYKANGDYERSNKTEGVVLVNNFMYHYVLNNDKVTNYLTPAQFEAHIEYLNANYKALNFNKVLSEEDIDTNSEYFLTSFDDGYYEHESIVKGILDKYQIKGNFAINVVNPKDLFDVNKVQVILKYYDSNKILERIKSYEKDFQNLWDKYSVVKSLDDSQVVFIKRYFQIEENSKKLLNEIFLTVPENITKNYYLTKSQIDSLLADGHITANHTMIHEHLTELSEEDIKSDIESYEHLMKNISSNKMVFYPYGSHNLSVRNVYFNHGYKYGFTTESGYSIINTKKGCMTLRRYDCISLERYT